MKWWRLLLEETHVRSIATGRNEAAVDKVSTVRRLISGTDNNHMKVIVSDLEPRNIVCFGVIRHMFHSSHGKYIFGIESKC